MESKARAKILEKREIHSGEFLFIIEKLSEEELNMTSINNTTKDKFSKQNICLKNITYDTVIASLEHQVEQIKSEFKLEDKELLVHITVKYEFIKGTEETFSLQQEEQNELQIVKWIVRDLKDEILDLRKQMEGLAVENVHLKNKMQEEEKQNIKFKQDDRRNIYIKEIREYAMVVNNIENVVTLDLPPGDYYVTFSAFIQFTGGSSSKWIYLHWNVDGVQTNLNHATCSGWYFIPLNSSYFHPYTFAKSFIGVTSIGVSTSYGASYPWRAHNIVLSAIPIEHNKIC
jgi:hypothetical protein